MPHAQTSSQVPRHVSGVTTAGPENSQMPHRRDAGVNLQEGTGAGWVRSSTLQDFDTEVMLNPNTKYEAHSLETTGLLTSVPLLTQPHGEGHAPHSPLAQWQDLRGTLLSSEIHPKEIQYLHCLPTLGFCQTPCLDMCVSTCCLLFFSLVSIGSSVS